MSLVSFVLTSVRRFFALLAAAGAAAHALENHRQPAAADLAELGMTGVRFKHY